MKIKLLIISLLLIVKLANAQSTFFVSNDGDNSRDGKSPANAWRTISKVNSFLFTAGDSILFKCGDRWVESLILPRNTLNISSYSAGAKPEISGFITPTWTNEGGGVYSFILPRLTFNPLNLFSINNVPQQVARFPDVDSTTPGIVDHGYFSCNPLTPTDTVNFTIIGGVTYRPAKNDEINLRPKKFRAEKLNTTNVSGTLVSYQRKNGILDGGAQPLETVDNSSGWFCTRRLNFLSRFGEWYVDPTTRKLSVYFGSQNPNSYDCKVSILDTLINCAARTFITINNIKLTGANTFAVNSVLGKNITINNCDASNGGCRGFSLVSVSNATISNCNATDFLEDGMAIYGNSYDNATIRNSTSRRSGLIMGMGSFNNGVDYSGMGLLCRNNGLFMGNVIDSTGDNCLTWQGSNVLIKNSIFSHPCFNLQDHGAIYTFQEAQAGNPPAPVIYTNRVVENCFFEHGIGNYYGTGNTGLFVSGIYNDGATMNVIMRNNTFNDFPRSANTNNEPLGNWFYNNNCFNTVRGVTLTIHPRRDSINMRITQNVFYNFASTAGGSQQNDFQIRYEDLNLSGRTIIQSVQRAGVWDSNYYNLPALPNWSLLGISPNSTTNYTFANYQIATGKDIHSTTLTNYVINSSNLLFIENKSDNNYSYLLSGNYLDARGNQLSGNQILAPWSSIILFYVSAVQPGIKVKLKVGH